MKEVDKMDNKSIRMITQNVKALNPHVFLPSSFREEEPKYRARFLISKKDEVTVKRIKSAMQEVYKNNENLFKDTGAVTPIELLKLPLHDGDKEKGGDANYANTYFINASSKYAPEIVKKINGQIIKITDEDEIYSGVICKASLNFFAYNVNGNKGIACSLGNIMKVKDGERISTRISAADDFANLDDDDFDFSF